MTDNFNSNKDKTMKELLQWVVKEFGEDINYRVKMSDGKVFKSRDWDRLNRGLDDKLQNEQK